MCQTGLDSLDMLFLSVLLSLGKGLSAIKDAQSLEPLLENLTVVRGELQRITVKIEHFDAF